MLPAVAWVSIGIAVASLIVVPGVAHMIKQFIAARRKARAAELAEVLSLYVTTAVHDEQFDRMEVVQAERHKENRDFLDTMRTEAQLREGKILGSIEANASQNRDESSRLGLALNHVTQRVDRLFERLPERRRP